eukprot:13770596-Heterocapsa_arctica.AAC.1
MHSWASIVLKDGSLTGHVLCWRDAHWSTLEQYKGKRAIRRPSRKRFKRWEDFFVKYFGTSWKSKAQVCSTWDDLLPRLLDDKRVR